MTASMNGKWFTRLFHRPKYDLNKCGLCKNTNTKHPCEWCKINPDQDELRRLVFS